MEAENQTGHVFLRTAKENVLHVLCIYMYIYIYIYIYIIYKYTEREREKKCYTSCLLLKARCCGVQLPPACQNPGK